MNPADAQRARQWTRNRPARELGEFGLIERLRRRLRTPPPAARQVPVGIGDDCAVLRVPSGWDLLLSCDIQIERRHFRREWLTPAELGRRAAAVNLSDIAAMGGLPFAALVSLGVPGDLSVEALEGLYDGLCDALAEADAALAGGNVTAADALILDVTVTGRVEEDQALRRSGARVGDVVFVTGFPGRAAAALATLDAGTDLWARLGERLARTEERPAPSSERLREIVRSWIAQPQARVAVGRYLLENHLAGATIDQSDGVAGDLRHICEESDVAIELDAEYLPVDPLLEILADAVSIEPRKWILGPSDDYELLFTVAAEEADRVFAMEAALGVPVAPIGRVTRGGGVVLVGADGQREELAGGWDHLAARGS